MKTINMIGSGNVACHLLNALKNASQFRVQKVAVRSLEKAKQFIEEELLVFDISNLQPADITIISVSDNAIQEVSVAIAYENSLVVHTSGTTAMQLLNDKNRKGVFYPLQTFSKNKVVNFIEVPL